MVEQLPSITTRAYNKKLHQEDVKYLGTHLREIDCKECMDMGASSGLEGLTLSINDESTVAYIDYKDDVPVWAYGINKEYTKGLGHCIWFLGTDAVKKNKRYFVEVSARVISHWVMKYGKLWNAISKDNHDSIRWLKSLGAEFKESTKDGYLIFTIERK